MSLRVTRIETNIDAVLNKMEEYNEDSKEYMILTKNLESLSESLVYIQTFELNRDAKIGKNQGA